MSLKMHVDDISSRSVLAQKRGLSPWRIGFVCCTLLALLWAAQMYVLSTFFGAVPIPWHYALGWGMFDWYLWGAFAILIARLARRFPLGRGRGWRAIAIHVFSAASISGVYCAMTGSAWLVLRPDDGSGASRQAIFGFSVVSWLPWNLLTYGAILGVVHAFGYYREYRDHEVRATQLEARLAQAQLEALKMQLHPHFLFNTLHAISTLIHKDPEAADRMVARLSEFLRHVLDSGGEQEVALEAELSFLRKYLEIERVRFGDRLDVHFGVEPETLGAAVPSLILQPLVENAIRHALAPHATPCTIEITAKRINGVLALEVVDSGPGLEAEDPAELREGVGLANTRARLDQLYGAAQRFELRCGTPNGLATHIEIPFSIAGEGEAGNGGA